MTSQLLSLDLALSCEQQNVKKVLQNKNETANCSLCKRISSAVSFPFSWLVTSIQNFAWRLVDPNWKAFVVKSQGHFVYNKHENTFDAAVTKMDQIFTSIIDNSTDPKEWHLIHKNEKTNRKQSQIWEQFSKQYRGTCLGNCVSMASTILKAKRPLSISELKKIESTESFVTTAQAVQLTANSAVEYNHIILSKGLSKPNKMETHTEKLAKLGLTLEEYLNENPEAQNKIDFLISSINNGIQKRDLGNKTIQWLSNLDPLSFGFHVVSFKRNALTRHMIKPGLELIKQLQMLPSENLSDVFTFKVNDFQEKIKNGPLSLKDPNLNCVMLVNGISATKKIGHALSIGHALLLEIDNQKGTYILYDNNRGFYQWDNLQGCLDGLEMRFKSEKYDSCEVVLSSLQ